jgi:hypothetical protein
MSEMKKLLESLEKLQECPPMEGGEMPPSPMNQGTPVSINVSMNASGKDHVADLLRMMQQAGLGGAQEVQPSMMPVRQDMERLRAIVGEPEMEADAAYADSIEEGFDGEITDEVWQHIAARRAELVDDEGMEPEEALEQAAEEIGVDPEELEDWLAVNVEGYDNSPDGVEGDPEYSDHKFMTKDLSGGINREKKAYKAAQRGDNAMAVEAIKAQLMAALEEKKAKPDYIDIDDDGNEEEPMKKAVKDKKEKKTNEADYNTMAALTRLKMQHDAEKKYRDSKIKNKKSMFNPSPAGMLDQETIAGLTRLKMQHDAEKKYRDSVRKKK